LELLPLQLPLPLLLQLRYLLPLHLLLQPLPFPHRSEEEPIPPAWMCKNSAAESASAWVVVITPTVISMPSLSTIGWQTQETLKEAYWFEEISALKQDIRSEPWSHPMLANLLVFWLVKVCEFAGSRLRMSDAFWSDGRLFPDGSLIFAGRSLGYD